MSSLNSTSNTESKSRTKSRCVGFRMFDLLHARIICEVVWAVRGCVGGAQQPIRLR